MNWNDTLFDGLRKVNRNLNNGFPLTPRAELMLTRIESTLCSGDGLSPETAFRAADERVAGRTVELLGMSAAAGTARREGAVAEIPVGENPYGVRSLFFTIG